MAEQSTFWRTDHGMVKTNKKLRKRSKLDYYPTPHALAVAALDLATQFLPEPPGAILDPGCGKGEWSRAVRQFWPDAFFWGVDLSRERLTACAGYDALSHMNYLDFSAGRQFPLIVGNPPYNVAEAFVWRSLDHLTEDGVLVFLLRHAFLATQGRYERMYSPLKGKARPFLVTVCSQRPSFTGDGNTDSTEYTLYFWRKQSARACQIEWVMWRDEAEQLALPAFEYS